MDKFRHTRKDFEYVLLSAIALLLLSGCGTTGPTKCSPSREVTTKQKAEAGDVDAQFQLGDWYSSSCGNHNSSEGFKWYQRAAEQGYPEAQFKIAVMYLYGFGVTKDTEESDKWIRKAAEQGQVAAMRSLGSMYLEGKRVTQDLDEAEKWYSLAAEQGDWLSRVQLKKLLDPAWVHTQQQVAEERKRAEEKRRTELAKRAKNRFGLISVSVIEAEETKRLRMEVSKAPSMVGVVTSDVPKQQVWPMRLIGGAIVGSLEGLFVLGPAGAVVGLLAGAEETVTQGLTSEERAEVKATLVDLRELFAKEKVEQNFQAQLLSLAENQQAGDLFTTDASESPSSIGNQLQVEIQEIGMFVPGWEPQNGRLWITAVTRFGTEPGNDSSGKRLCYASGGEISLAFWSKDNGARFRRGLDDAYHYLSNKILSELIGLAPDPVSISRWEHTAEVCELE